MQINVGKDFISILLLIIVLPVIYQDVVSAMQLTAKDVLQQNMDTIQMVCCQYAWIAVPFKVHMLIH